MSKGIVPPSLSDGRKFPPPSSSSTCTGHHCTSTTNATATATATATTIGEQQRRQPLTTIPQRRSRKRNPFREQHRNNFPDLDDAFKTTTTSTDKIIDETDDEIIDDNEFVDNYSDIEGSSTSILNMSIGARAALNDHARHVAKFGIDGETNLEGVDESDSDSNEIYTGGENNNLFLDKQWDNFLDTSRINSSGFGGSTTNSNIDIRYSADRSGYNDESIEVMTDVSHDYFNSSRVNLLITPERNKNRRVDMATTRNGEDVDDVPTFDYQQGSWFETTDDNPCCNENDENESDHHREHFIQSGQIQQQDQQAENSYDFDQRGSSFINVNDISRISNTNSDTNRTPDTSFQAGFQIHRSHGLKVSDEDHAFAPTILGAAVSSPSRKANNDSSFFSIPEIRETEQLLSFDSNDQQVFDFNPSAATTSKRGGCIQKGKENIPSSSRSKENISPDKSDNSVSSIQSTFSSFMTEAQSMAKQMADDVEQSMVALESLSGDFLRAMNISQVDPPSPISQELSTPSSSRQEGTTNRQKSDKSSSPSVCNSSIGTASSRIHNTSNSSSSSSPAVEVVIQTHLTGRKRYRTVVPRRVYLDVPSQHFEHDEEQDSFAVRSNPETSTCRYESRGGISLLESFDEVATYHTF
jgi:hypothetical protein